MKAGECEQVLGHAAFGEHMETLYAVDFVSRLKGGERGAPVHQRPRRDRRSDPDRRPHDGDRPQGILGLRRHPACAAHGLRGLADDAGRKKKTIHDEGLSELDTMLRELGGEA